MPLLDLQVRSLCRWGQLGQNPNEDWEEERHCLSVSFQTVSSIRDATNQKCGGKDEMRVQRKDDWEEKTDENAARSWNADITLRPEHKPAKTPAG